MKRSLYWIPLAVALLLAVAPAVSMDRMFFGGDDGESFDLSELRDGESRTFGRGDKQITAARNGDVVAIARDASVDGKAFSMNCRLSTDTCEILSREGSDQVMVRVESHRECKNGEGDCEDIEVIGLGDGSHTSHNVWVEKSADCDGPDCEKSIEVILGDVAGAARSMVFITDDADGTQDGHSMVFFGGDGDGAHVMRIGSDQATLRCPQGDATIQVEADEADGVYLCPKHSVPMERTATMKTIRRKVKIGG